MFTLLSSATEDNISTDLDNSNLETSFTAGFNTPVDTLYMSIANDWKTTQMGKKRFLLLIIHKFV